MKNFNKTVLPHLTANALPMRPVLAANAPLRCQLSVGRACPNWSGASASSASGLGLPSGDDVIAT